MGQLYCISRFALLVTDTFFPIYIADTKKYICFVQNSYEHQTSAAENYTEHNRYCIYPT